MSPRHAAPVLLVSLAAAALALGPLNPPAGEPEPTNRTLQEVYDAIQTHSATPPAGNRQAALPGPDFPVGTVQIAGITAPLIEADLSFFRTTVAVPGSGGGGGKPSATARLVVPTGTLDAVIGQQVTTNAYFSAAIQLNPPGGGATPATLIDISLIAPLSVTTTLRERGDGSYAAVCEIELAVFRYAVTDANGSFCWDVTLNAPCP